MSILEMPHVLAAIARRSNVLRLPYSLDFSALPDGAVPGWLGAAQVAAGVASVMPELGPELVINGNMEDGDPPTGWSSVLNAVLAAVADERTGGSGAQSISVARNGSSNPAAIQPVSVSIGAWYQLAGWLKGIDCDSMRIRLYDNPATTIQAATTSYTDTAWGKALLTTRAAVPSWLVYLLLTASGADGTSGRFDDISLRAFTLSSLFSGPTLRLGRQDVRVRAAWTGTAGTQAGVAIIGDGCGIVAYHDGTNLRLDKWTTPTTWTSLINVAAAYGAGRAVELRRSGTTVQAWYNGVQVGGDQTVADQNILDARHVALFSTYDGNTASQFNVEAI
jgi:hypothetical protein